MKRVLFFKEPVATFCFALRVMNSVHFVCRNEVQNETNGTKEPASVHLGARNTVNLVNTHLSDSLLERIKLGVKGHGPCAVDDPALDVSAKVHLDHIVRS